MTAAAPSPSIIPSGNTTADYLETIRLIQTLAARFERSIKIELDRREIGIEPSAAMILFWLGENEVTATELRIRYYLRTNVSYNLKKLVEVEMLVRRSHGKDKRSALIKSTDQGKAVANIVAVLFERQALDLAKLNVLTPIGLDRTATALRQLLNFVTEQIAYWQR